MLDSLVDKFARIFSELKSHGRVDEKVLDKVLKEVRMALLEADVHVKVVRSFLDKIKQKLLGQKITDSLKPQQLILNTIHQELVEMLGSQTPTLDFGARRPRVVVLVGLQGSGKTTTAAKLAHHYHQKGFNPLLVPADLSRPAAIKQLQTLARSMNLACYDTQTNQELNAQMQQALDQATQQNHEMVLIDTAGRLQTDEALMNELQSLVTVFQKPKIVFVADALTGQEALKVVQTFGEHLSLDGVILTKLDGDARGGAALSIGSVTGCPVLFMGLGEKPADLKPFDPQVIADRLLDRGDLLGLALKAKEAIGEAESKELQKKFKTNQFNIEDFKAQLSKMKKLGSIKNLMGMLPGGQSMLKQVNMDHAEGEMKKKEAIMDSMTVKERQNPKILNGSRRLRIANGSGTKVSDVNRFLKEFYQMQKMMKKLTSKSPMALFRQFK